MSEHNQAAADLAFLRGLAEAGGDGPMRGGAILALCGVVFGGASLACAAAAAYRYPIGPIWVVAGVLFFLSFFVVKRRTPKEGSSRQVAAGVAWSALGISSFFIWLSFAIVAQRTGEGVVFAAIGPVYLSLYAGAWLMCAMMWRKKWLWLAGYASAAAAILTAWSVGGQLQVFWLVYGLSLMAVLTLPGLYLMRQAKVQA